MSELNVESKNLSDKLSSFNSEIKKLDDLSTKLIDETTKLEESWKGKTAEGIIDELKKYKDVFSKIKQQNQNYVSYVNKVIELYKSAEDAQLSTMETNGDSLNM